MPVTLLDFKGFIEKQGNLLTWSFADEKEVVSVEIQKSKNGQSFTPLCEGSPLDSKINKSTLFFTDEMPFELTYYRLKIKDLEGKFDYSKIIALKRSHTVRRDSYGEGGSDKDFTVFPNPTTHDFSIQFHQEPAAILECRDIFGRLIFTEKLDLKPYIK